MKQNKMERAGTGLIIVGLFLLVVSGIMLGYNIWDNQRAKSASETVLQQLEQAAEAQPSPTPQTASTRQSGEAVSVPLYVTYPDMEMPTVEIDGHSYIGRIDIPTLGLSLPVMSQWSYPNLKIAPCRYVGSVYEDNMVIAAHNYTSHFGTLKYLSAGDEVIFTDADGNVFTYEVAEIEQLMPTDIEKMTDSGWDLTLFTCTIGGSYRVTVRCTRIG
jgi:sortase A